MHIFNIKDKIFDTDVSFLIGGKYDEANKILKKFKNKELVSDDCSGQLLRDNKGKFRIVFAENEKDLGTIAHELFHLVIRICEDKGILNSAEDSTGKYPGDETGAYLMGYYFETVVASIRSNKFNKKKKK